MAKVAKIFADSCDFRENSEFWRKLTAFGLTKGAKTLDFVDQEGFGTF